MKKLFKFLQVYVLVMSTHLCLIAQQVSTNDSITLKKRIYKVSVITSDSKKNSGYLANLDDSNLYLSPSLTRFNLLKTDDYVSSYPYDHIEKIEIKRKAAAGRGAWQGALIGLAVGVIAGLASGDDPVIPAYTNNPNDPLGNVLGNAFVITGNAFRMTAGEKAVALGALGAGTGSLLGALMGSLLKKKFIIGRNKQKFLEMRQNIVEKLYIR